MGRDRAATVPPWLFHRAVQWASLWGTPGLEERTIILFSKRFRRGLGSANVQRKVVRLAAFLKDGEPEILEEVLCHELAHVVVHERASRRYRAHGSEWAGLMIAAGFEPRARTPHPTNYTAPPPRRRRRWIYLHHCPACGAERVARRVVRRWRCTVCMEEGLDGKLDIWRAPL